MTEESLPLTREELEAFRGLGSDFVHNMADLFTKAKELDRLQSALWTAYVDHCALEGRECCGDVFAGRPDAQECEAGKRFGGLLLEHGIGPMSLGPGGRNPVSYVAVLKAERDTYEIACKTADEVLQEVSGTLAVRNEALAEAEATIGHLRVRLAQMDALVRVLKGRA